MVPAPVRLLNDGNELPSIGLGTFGLRGTAGVQSIASAVQVGYRLVDTALRYQNEADVGAGIRESGIARELLTVTTKLRGRDHGYEQTLRGFERSRANLGLDHVDLYLIHWPLPRVDKYVDSWRAMIRLREEGLVRSIGVSNFTPTHLARLIDETGVTPAVNQIELHPSLPQAALREFHAAHGIVTSGWSPLGRTRARGPGGMLRAQGRSIIQEIAATRDVTPTQVVLRWHVQQGSVPIPKSGNPLRQRTNLDVFGFLLNNAEIKAIAGLETGRRLWWSDPDRHHEY
ncbi:MAG: aldo/keto reductase [Burkholderiaceae bacterium]|nr:aldo/keto reductase [Microbacteriaceae bacterium]